MVFAAIRFAGGKRRHEVVEISEVMKRIEFVIFVGVTIKVATAAATDDLLSAAGNKL